MARSKHHAVTVDETGATEPIMENSGLCGTCENAALCMYLGDAEHPVLECEEFTHHRAGVTRPAMRRMNLAAAPRSEARLPLAAGLCFDCDNREGCVFEKPEGGVWQCEEYR